MKNQSRGYVSSQNRPKKQITKIAKASVRGSTIAVKKDTPVVVLPQPQTETGYFYTLLFFLKKLFSVTFVEV
jgi:hypothetical protein